MPSYSPTDPVCERMAPRSWTRLGAGPVAGRSDSRSFSGTGAVGSGRKASGARSVPGVGASAARSGTTCWPPVAVVPKGSLIQPCHIAAPIAAPAASTTPPIENAVARVLPVRAVGFDRVADLPVRRAGVAAVAEAARGAGRGRDARVGFGGAAPSVFAVGTDLARPRRGLGASAAGSDGAVSAVSAAALACVTAAPSPLAVLSLAPSGLDEGERRLRGAVDMGEDSRTLNRCKAHERLGNAAVPPGPDNKPVGLPRIVRRLQPVGRCNDVRSRPWRRSPTMPP